MGAGNELLLEIKGLQKSYGETRALRGLELQGHAHTVHTVFGENGSGKSTMVKILAGIVAPDRGEVRLAGAPISRYAPRAMQRLGVVPVLQEVLIAPNRSVLENIFLGCESLIQRRIPYQERRRRASAALERITQSSIDLDGLAGKLSLAHRQLVVIARALVRDPQILILDEATAALDFSDREMLFAAIRSFVGEGRLVIFISHRVDEVEELSDVVTVLHVGRAVATVAKRDLSAARLLALVSSASSVEEKAVHAP